MLASINLRLLLVPIAVLLGFVLGRVTAPVEEVEVPVSSIPDSGALLSEAHPDVEAEVYADEPLVLQTVEVVVPVEEGKADSVTISHELLRLLVTHPEVSKGAQLFGNDHRLEDALKIQEPEKVAIQQLWRAHKARIKELQVNVAEFEEHEDGSVSFYIPDLSADYQREQDAFSRGITDVLGKNRGSIFQTIKQTDQRLKLKGGETQYVLQMEASGNGEWHYRTHVEDAEGKRVWVGASIPEPLRHLTDAVGIQPKLQEENVDDE